jgi:hypothetical protein
MFFLCEDSLLDSGFEPLLANAATLTVFLFNFLAGDDFTFFLAEELVDVFAEIDFFRAVPFFAEEFFAAFFFAM